MHRAYRHLLKKSKYPALHSYAHDMCALAKNIGNAALFRMRNHFTASSKGSLTDNETSVEAEVLLLGRKPGKVLSYTQLERVMRLTENPDFFAGLPMQSAQYAVRQTCVDFKDWLAALRDYGRHPDKYLSVPRMPKYCKKELKSFTITNQDASLYPHEGGGSELKLPLTRERFVLTEISPDSDLREVKIVPYYGEFLLIVTVEEPEAEPQCSLTKTAAIDFGVENTAAIVTNGGRAVLYKGGAIKAGNQWFNKKRASLTSAQTAGKKHKGAHSRSLEALSMHRDLFLKDSMHKISRSVVNGLMDDGIGLVVLGVNKGWKQGVNMGRRNNQVFVSIPFDRLRQMITYKCLMAGITVVEQEESYTSKADFLAGDDIPVYGGTDGTPSFSGHRINRGLYRSADGTVLNADLNAAANIMRKAVSGAFGVVTDFSFLQCPEVYGFHDLNPV